MSGILSVLSPTAITAAMLISSTAAEADYAVFNSGTTYAIGDKCISTVTHRIYESAVAGNIGHDPTDINNRVGTLIYWIDIGATNRWLMFDDQISSQTAVASPLTVVLTPGAFNSFYFGGLDAESMTVTIKDAPAGNVIYSLTSSLEGSAPDDYYEYFFDPFKPLADYLVSGIESYNAMEITLTLTKGSGLVKCGLLGLGFLKPLGKTLKGAKAKPKTFSYIKVDSYGNNYIKRGKSAKDLSATAYLDLSEADTVLATVTDLLDVPCLWSCTDSVGYSGLRSFGLGSADINYDYQNNCTINLNVIGMI